MIVGDRYRLAEVTSLTVVNPLLTTAFDDWLVPDELGDRLGAESSGDFDERFDEELIGGVAQHGGDKLAVDPEIRTNGRSDPGPDARGVGNLTAPSRNNAGEP